VFNNFFSESRAVYEIMWKNVAQPEQSTDDNITRRMRFVCWITEATDTHSEYVILLVFPWLQWLRERALMLRYAFIFVTLHVKLETFGKLSWYVLRASLLLYPT
jgi:hypothetical protein